MNAREITIALRGRWHGRYGVAKCPAHDDKRPSLQISDGEKAPLFTCHAGCERRDIIDALKAMNLWHRSEDDPAAQERFRERKAAQERERVAEDARRSARARKLWTRATAPQGTPVERYLQGRSITADIPPSIRYLPDCKHADTGLYLPAMIAAVQRWPTRAVVGVHRTYLKADGSGKAPVSSNKKMLGPCGGGAVRLAAHGSPLIVAEGIETALSVQQESGHPAWAALSKGGMERLMLPAEVVEVIIAADHDEPGLEAAKKAAQRWTAEGRKVRIAKPPVEGWDFNDWLMSRNVATFPGRAA